MKPATGPFGAVKEQSSGLYANEYARRGYAALAFDPSFTGESGGEVRDVASPDISTEDLSAAVDTRIKAVATSSPTPTAAPSRAGSTRCPSTRTAT